MTSRSPISFDALFAKADAGERIEPAAFNYEGAVFKRVVAFALDLVIIGILIGLFAVIATIIGLLSFGLLLGPLLALGSLVPLAYHTWFLGGHKSATIGMQFMGIELRTWDGRRPGYLQGAFQTIVFYVSCTVTSWLILVAVFFNDRKRTLHDIICGTLVINTSQ
ncbi:MAG: RDD family protein [Alphaproteobacteria bacterium]|nr:RDD family protein [Alphaproteobacteria bacterium]MBT4017634.1 RDD family protein [Alphaproteobacteria bacterium]MBT7746741.1 RDD family protein [Alphaproteobacteria bacterium]